MDSKEAEAFKQLVKQAAHRCFSKELMTMLTEAESKHLSNEIFEQTGLVIGWKSLKNYSRYAAGEITEEAINPSVATLDTLARYVSGAPKTQENVRKQTNQFSYWYRFRESNINHSSPITVESPATSRRVSFSPVFYLLILLGVGLALFLLVRNQPPSEYAEEFTKMESGSLKENEWFVKDEVPFYWAKHTISPGHLTLYTLSGDNYPANGKITGIKNLLFRRIHSDCFSAEVNLSHFIPSKNWQQAGLVFMEDTSYTSKSVRISLSYNDFFGGFHQPGEIIIQILAAVLPSHRKPEEIAHFPLFTYDTTGYALLRRNLQKSALRVEKQGNTYRFSYATGDNSIFAFKEIAKREMDFTPKFVAVFASSGETTTPVVIPVSIDSFYINAACK